VETITDVELVEKIQEESCNNSLKELINRHSALCVDICKKYTPAMYASGVPYSDIYEDKAYIVYKSALSFKPEKKVKIFYMVREPSSLSLLECHQRQRLFVKC